jgi:mRNA interferase RelE/StbE
VSRDLRKIDKNQADRILQKITEELPDRADTFASLSGKFSGLRKFRVGDYRVIYSIIGDTAIVLRVSHLREAYR